MQEALNQGAGQGMHAQSALDRGELHFRSLLEKLPVGAYTCDAEGLITYFNQHAVRLWGRTPNLNDPEDRYCGSFRLFLPDGSPVAHDECWMALALKMNREYNGREIIVERPDGGRLTALAHANPLHDESGKLLGAVNVLVDISERKRIEREKAELLARENAARLEAEKASKHLRFLADASRVLNASLDYETTLGNVARLAVPEIADWCAVDFLLEDGFLQRVALVHSDAVKLELARSLQQRYPSKPGAPYGIMRVFETARSELYPDISDAMLQEVAYDAEELSRLRELGLRSAMVVPLVCRSNLLGAISFVVAESGRRYVRADLELAEELARRAAVAIDNAWLYRQSQALNEELEAKIMSRTEDLRQVIGELEHFAYAVSHDLRSPLGTIAGFSEALVEDHAAELSSQARHYLARIHGNVERMAELIDDILLLSRVSRKELRLEAVNPCELVDDIARAFLDDHPLRQVDFSCDRGLIARADPGLLRIALENLIDNAWKFTCKRQQAKIAFGATQEGDKVVYWLRDNGVGFDMSYADKLFQPFQRLHDAEEYPGTGIGLATVKRIIERHGGRIWVESAVDEGATFFFTLGESGAAGLRP
jgi:PAS domain S-box-containing protein